MPSRINARLRLKFAVQMARHIQAFRKGDKTRFDRMVGQNGKGIVTEAILVKNIKAIAEEAKVYYPVATNRLLNWLQG